MGGNISGRLVCLGLLVLLGRQAFRSFLRVMSLPRSPRASPSHDRACRRTLKLCNPADTEDVRDRVLRIGERALLDPLDRIRAKGCAVGLEKPARSGLFCMGSVGLTTGKLSD